MDPPVNPRRRPARHGLPGLAACAVLLGLMASTPARADTLGDGLDAPGLTWTTGGAAPWFYQTTNTYDGVDAAQSGAVTNIYTGSWLETTVTGRVTVLFSWKFTTAIPNNFYFTFSTNGAFAWITYATVDWRQQVVSFAGGTNRLWWSTYNLTTGPGGVAWLDQVIVTNIAGLKPTFLTQPLPLVVVPELYPDATVLPVTVVGDIPMSYQWQRSGTNLSQGYPFSGVNLPTLTVHAQTPAANGDYRLVASNAWGMATSAVSTVSVVPAKPFIPPGLPSDALIAPGGYAELSFYTYGTPPFGYQWFKDGAAILFATNYYHPIYPALLADTGGYSVIVTNLYGAATSRVAQVTVSTALPSIVTGPNPEVLEMLPGDYASFSAEAAGPEYLSYSWRRVGDPAELASWTSLSLSSVDPTNSGFYQVIVANNNGAVTSRVSVLAVAPVTALALAVDAPQLTVTNDLPYRQWRADVNGANAHDGVCAARTPEIGAWDSAPFSTVVTGPTNVSFWWRISAAAEAYLDIAVDGVVGNTISGETAWQKQSLDLPAGEHKLTWNFRKENAGNVGADAAWVDQFTFGGDSSGGGVLITNFTTGGGADWYLQATHTHAGADAWQSGTIGTTQQTWLHAPVTGPGTLSFWWMVSSSGINDPLEFYVDGALQANIVGEVAWQQASFPLGSGEHQLEWRYSKAATYSGGMDAGWVAEVMFTPGDLLAEALDTPELVWATGSSGSVASNPVVGWFYQTNTTSDGSDAAQSPPLLASGSSQVETTVNGPAVLSANFSLWGDSDANLEFTIDGVLQPGFHPGEPGPVRWYTSDYPIPTGSHIVRWTLNAGQQDWTNATAWLDNVRITPIQKPFITSEPTDVVVTEGQPAGFFVSALSPEPITYQWYRGAPLAGRTNDWLSFASAQLSDAGNYFVVVANSLGSTTSRVALLTVNGLPPVFTNTLLARWVYPRETIRLEVGATSPRTLTYIWQFTTNGFATTYELQRGPDRTYDIASVGYEHSGTWRVVALDAAVGVSASTTAKLVVGSRFYRLYPLANSIPAGTDVFVKAMNEAGAVVGQAGYGGPGTPRAYKFDRYGDTVLHGTIYSDYGQANGINAAGVVVGRAMGPTGMARAVRWRSRFDPEDLGIPPGFDDAPFEAVAINDLGQIVVNGNFQSVARSYALRWQDDNWQFLRDQEYGGIEYQTVAFGISSLGHIVGSSSFDSQNTFNRASVFDPHNEPEHPYDSLPTTDLPGHYPIDGNYSRATGVNDRGHVVGWRKPSKFTGVARAFVIARGELIDLDIFSSSSLAYLKINNYGDIIADDFSTVTNDIGRPMVIRNDGLLPHGAGGSSYTHHRAFLLQDLVLGGIGPFESFSDVTAIQESGGIAGTGRIPGLGFRPYLLVPASSPDNRPPVARDDTVTRFTDRVMVSFSQRLLGNDSDPDPNEVLSLVSYSTGTTNGGTVFRQGDWLTYTPTNGYTGPDQFSYTITDHRGGLASANVTILPESPRDIPGTNEIRFLFDRPGTMPALRFHGTPGVTYRIERIDTLFGGTWQTVAVLTAGPDGALDTLDPGAIFRDLRFYRAVQQP